MSIEEILYAMDEKLDTAKQIPFSGGKITIDHKVFSEYIQQIRLNLPSEIKQAQQLVNDRKIIINDAKAEAAAYLKKNKEEADKLISEQTIAKQAQQRAQDIINNAQQKAKKMEIATNEYVENMLTRLDELLTSDISDVRKMLTALKNNKK